MYLCWAKLSPNISLGLQKHISLFNMLCKCWINMSRVRTVFVCLPECGVSLRYVVCIYKVSSRHCLPQILIMALECCVVVLPRLNTFKASQTRVWCTILGKPLFECWRLVSLSAKEETNPKLLGSNMSDIYFTWKVVQKVSGFLVYFCVLLQRACTLWSHIQHTL